MEEPSQEFRKLNLDLPKHSLSRSGKWLRAGLVLMFLILALIVVAYLQHRFK